MARQQIIYNPAEPSIGVAPYMQAILAADFDLVPFTPGMAAVNSAVLTVYQTAESEARPWYHALEQMGCRIIVDHLLDSDVHSGSTSTNRHLTLRNGCWMWYSTSLRYTRAGFDQYRPQRCVDRDFLMMMNKQRPHRDLVLEQLAPLLNTALYSYVDRGIDIAESDSRQSHRDLHWYDYFNPAWYDRTGFSVVVESWMRSDAYFANPGDPEPNALVRLRPNYRTEVSEKIFKPLAFQHPFIVYGSEGTLRYLQALGFETFDNLWDESYDSVTSDSARFDAVTRTVMSAVAQPLLLDPLTQQKLQHNAKRFWDQTLVTDLVRQEIIHDILEFLS
jgi:hypothetical protein